MWCIPPKQDAEFVCSMENVLEVYKRPYNPKNPVVCMDETSKQLVAETRTPQPSVPGKARRYDYEYERNGAANVFMFTEVLANWRRAEGTERRTAIDWAHQMRDVVDTRYADAEVVTFVMDNLNTHTPASFYKAFKPAEARRLAEKIEIVYTPKHGSWRRRCRDRTGHTESAMHIGPHRQRRYAEAQTVSVGEVEKRKRQ